MRKLYAPSHYYEILRLAHKNKTAFQDKYFITLIQTEIASELNIQFGIVNNCYKDYLQNGLIIKQGMNYYMTQKGVKMVQMYEDHNIDFICYYNLMNKMCSNIAFYHEQMLVVPECSELKAASELTSAELDHYLDYMISEGLIEVRDERKYITPKAVEEYLFDKQNFFA